MGDSCPVHRTEARTPRLLKVRPPSADASLPPLRFDKPSADLALTVTQSNITVRFISCTDIETEFCGFCLLLRVIIIMIIIIIIIIIRLLLE